MIRTCNRVVGHAPDERGGVMDVLVLQVEYIPCLTYIHTYIHTYRRCDRDWPPPTSKQSNRLEALEVASVKATSFPCLPFPHSHPRPSCLPACLFACPRPGLCPNGRAPNIRRQPSSTLARCFVHQHIHRGKTKKESESKKERKRLSILHYTQPTRQDTHTHTPHTGKKCNPSIHPSILFTATRIASPGLSR